MHDIHQLLNHHKNTVFFEKGNASVDCKLRPPSYENEYPMKGFTSFIGLTITESGMGVFADSFELTVNIDDVLKYTSKLPAKGWGISVKLPQLQYKEYSFYVESAAIDRTIGICLLKCSRSNKGI
ncbi:TPA: hypothetical protein IAA87_05865 [Candidatus Avigastranaerophilus faecigallinarum]|nr:hypothetical protein [Candidatus Avigastranaerophilus faecigallinarum]